MRKATSVGSRLLMVLALGVVLALGACAPEEEPMEQGLEETGDALEETGDKLEEGVEDTGEEIEDTVEDLEEDVDNPG